MPGKRLKEFLDAEGIRYLTISHSAAYTAQQTAAAAHIPGQELAKTVMVKLEGKMAMAVLPASFKVDLDQLREASGAATAELASEAEFNRLFPDCDGGAMPPFGNLYGMDVYVAEALTLDETIAFNACSHTELVRMAYADYERLVRPVVIKFAMRAGV